jgi:hypothetical protein
MEKAGPTNRHRLIMPDARQATHVAIDRTRGVALPSVDTDDRHTAEVDHVNDAVLQRYGVKSTVRCSLFHGDPCDRVVERVHVLELHGGALSCSARLDGRAASVDARPRTVRRSAGVAAPVAPGRTTRPSR